MFRTNLKHYVLTVTASLAVALSGLALAEESDTLPQKDSTFINIKDVLSARLEYSLQEKDRLSYSVSDLKLLTSRGESCSYRLKVSFSDTGGSGLFDIDINLNSVAYKKSGGEGTVDLTGLLGLDFYSSQVRVDYICHDQKTREEQAVYSCQESNSYSLSSSEYICFGNRLGLDAFDSYLSNTEYLGNKITLEKNIRLLDDIDVKVVLVEGRKITYSLESKEVNNKKKSSCNHRLTTLLIDHSSDVVSKIRQDIASSKTARKKFLTIDGPDISLLETEFYTASFCEEKLTNDKLIEFCKIDKSGDKSCLTNSTSNSLKLGLMNEWTDEVLAHKFRFNLSQLKKRRGFKNVVLIYQEMGIIFQDLSTALRKIKGIHGKPYISNQEETLSSLIIRSKKLQNAIKTMTLTARDIEALKGLLLSEKDVILEEIPRLVQNKELAVVLNKQVADTFDAIYDSRLKNESSRHSAISACNVYKGLGGKRRRQFELDCPKRCPTAFISSDDVVLKTKGAC